MDLSRIRPYAHKHCRFKLRSGKLVYGVIWEVEVAGQDRIYFASVRDYERLQHSTTAVQVIPMQPEEIMAVELVAMESLAS